MSTEAIPAEPTIESVTEERDDARRQLALAEQEIGNLRQHLTAVQSIAIGWEQCARVLATTVQPMPMAPATPQLPQG